MIGSGSSRECQCHGNRGLCLSGRQAGRTGACLLSIVAVAFTFGFFWGKRAGLEEYTEHAEQSVLSDGMYTALYERAGSEAAAEGEIDTTASLPPDTDVDTTVTMAQEIEGINTTNPVVATVDQVPPDATGAQYSAHLIGFGTERAAQQFINRLRVHDIDTTLRTRTSKARTGKTIAWYQVVTAPFDEKDQLLAHIDRIREHVTLHDIRIVEQQRIA